MTKQEILFHLNVDVAYEIGVPPEMEFDCNYDSCGNPSPYPVLTSLPDKYHYSTNPAAADEVKQFLLKCNRSIHISTYNYPRDSFTRVTICESEYLLPYSSRAETEPLALCLAVLPGDRREYYQQLLRECGE